ncbi:CsbD family protein [Streptomyces showdoensis]|uniref:General stress protein CsbD n=1 Tax=Streptomyces showdoensis TaxID=68268 RepID=A0A2P2GQH7_STREW|nr:CsbD family protein [Streptomyces showdoensis]KKZ73750.1 general stress protein CsbD [Streptomyces showdoensis]
MSGAMDKAKGRLKEITGRITGQERLEAEGKADRTKARIREKAQSIRHRAEGVLDSFRHDHR